MINMKTLILPLFFCSAAASAYEVQPGLGFVDYISTAETGDFDASAGKLNDQYWISDDDSAIRGCFLRTVDLDLSQEPWTYKLKPSIKLQTRLRMNDPNEVNKRVLKVNMRYKMRGSNRTNTASFDLPAGQLEQVYRDPQAGWTRMTLGWQDFSWHGVDVSGNVGQVQLEVCDATEGQRLQIWELKLTVLPQR